MTTTDILEITRDFAETNEQRLIRPLFAGPVDIVGDVHGEIDALSALLVRLGYDASGDHADGRRLVFVGDLCDRGPDSPAVIERVKGLVERGRAQCVVGNHEMNLLRKEQKHGNHWYFDGDQSRHEKAFGPSKQVTPEQAKAIREFLTTLPVALERPDLRVVHAAWRPEDVDACRTFYGTVLTAYEVFDRLSQQTRQAVRLASASRAEKQVFARAMKNKEPLPPFPRHIAAWEEYRQMSNPIRVMTSGLERVARAQFKANGKLRMVERVRWWDDYYDTTPVVFGHYWRWWDSASQATFSKGEPDLFEKDRPCGWQRNAAGEKVAFCIDYSAGARFKERKLGRTGKFHGRLAALRWPERQVVFDDDPPDLQHG